MLPSFCLWEEATLFASSQSISSDVRDGFSLEYYESPFHWKDINIWWDLASFSQQFQRLRITFLREIYPWTLFWCCFAEKEEKKEKVKANFRREALSVISPNFQEIQLLWLERQFWSFFKFAYIIICDSWKRTVFITRTKYNEYMLGLALIEKFTYRNPS